MLVPLQSPTGTIYVNPNAVAMLRQQGPNTVVFLVNGSDPVAVLGPIADVAGFLFPPK